MQISKDVRNYDSNCDLMPKVNDLPPEVMNEEEISRNTISTMTYYYFVRHQIQTCENY